MENLNPKQKEVVALTEGPVLVIAGAGTGKTKALTHRVLQIIKNGVSPRNILAITFTNKAAGEMKERIEKLINTEKDFSPVANDHERPFVSTFHAMGVHILKENAPLLKLPRHFNIFDKNDSKKAVKEALEHLGFDTKQHNPGKICALISKEKGKFVNIDEFEENSIDNHYNQILFQVWKKYEEILWREKALDFDDLLLKTANLLRTNREVLEHYQDRWRYIHIDEYQDTNEVQYMIAKLLADKNKNIFVVGDVDQCLVKGTQITMVDGTTRPIETVNPDDMVLSNYGSGDVRGARVTDIFSRPFSGNLVSITTKTGRTVTTTPEHIHFAGYRSGTTPQLYFVYLMHKKNFGFRLGTSQMYTNGQKQPVSGFVQRCNQEHGDSVWIIGTYTTPNEARKIEYTLSLKYQIPTLPFVARKGLSKNGYIHDQQTINQIFNSFDTETAGNNLLKDLKLSRDYPHHSARSRNSNRRNIVITLCGDHRGKTPMHRISIIGNDEEGKVALTSIGLSVRQAKLNSKSWRFETANRDYGKLLEIVENIKTVLPDAKVIKTARLGNNADNEGLLRSKNALSLIPASSVSPGMALFDQSGGYSIVDRIEHIKSEGLMVYDINIENTHNFIANGVITHNSIYSWRGANIKNILNFEKDYPNTKVILLEQNYRSTKTIIRAANEVIIKNKFRVDRNLSTENPDGEKIVYFQGFNENHEAHFIAKKAKELIAAGTPAHEIAVLYRANFQSRALEEAFLAQSTPYQILGTRFFERAEVKDVLSYIKAALNPESFTDMKRVINVPARGIGKVTLIKIFSGKIDELPKSMQEKVSNFKNLLNQIKEKIAESTPSEVIKFVIKETGLEDNLKKNVDEDVDRIENMRELATLAVKYDDLKGEEGIEKLLTEAALASDQDSLMHVKKDAESSGVKLMTVHAAKGLEFDYCFISGLEDNLFPHRKFGENNLKDEDSEEERRLFYVALTRAKKQAFLTGAETRTIFGTLNQNLPSEFIGDISPDLIEVAEIDDDGSGWRKPLLVIDF